MILGTGIDLVDVKRIKNLMKNHEDRFLEKYFTPHEVAHIQSIFLEDNKALSLAKRFAAKEACTKALGTGFREGIYLKDIEVKNDALGKPILCLYNGALSQLGLMTPKNMAVNMCLSLTDEYPYAQAQVIIEAI